MEVKLCCKKREMLEVDEEHERHQKRKTKSSRDNSLVEHVERSAVAGSQPCQAP